MSRITNPNLSIETNITLRKISYSISYISPIFLNSLTHVEIRVVWIKFLIFIRIIPKLELAEIRIFVYKSTLKSKGVKNPRE